MYWVQMQKDAQVVDDVMLCSKLTPNTPFFNFLASWQSSDSTTIFKRKYDYSIFSPRNFFFVLDI